MSAGVSHRGHVHRWTCPACRDEMCEHFRRSHERICAAVAISERAQVDALLHSLRIQ